MLPKCNNRNKTRNGLSQLSKVHFHRQVLCFGHFSGRKMSQIFTGRVRLIRDAAVGNFFTWTLISKYWTLDLTRPIDRTRIDRCISGFNNITPTQAHYILWEIIEGITSFLLRYNYLSESHQNPVHPTHSSFQ